MKRFLILPFALVALSSSFSSANVLAELTDKSAKVVHRGSMRHCNADVSFRVEASDASFFEKRLEDLGALYNSALNQIYARCPGIKTVKVYGMVDNFEVVKARSGAAQGWALQMEPSKLAKVAAKIPGTVRTYGDLPKLKAMFKPFQKVKGIQNTVGYQTFAANSKNIVDFLNLRRENFDGYAQAMAAAANTKKSAKTVEDVLEVVGYYDPNRANAFRLQYRQIVEATALAEIDTMLGKTLTPQQSLEAAVKLVSAQVTKKPLSSQALVSVDERFSSWLGAKIEAHEAENSGRYLDAAQAHGLFARSLKAAPLDALLPVSLETSQTAGFWFETLSEEVLAENLAEAIATLEATGESYIDAGLVFESGVSLAEEFTKFGFADEAELVLDSAISRSEALIEAGLQGYVADLTAARMTRDTVASYREEAAVFYELAEDFPGFLKYSEAIEAGIARGQATECSAQFERVSSARDAERMLDVGGQLIGFRDLTCELYANDNVLEKLSFGWGGRSGTMRIATSDDTKLEFDLALTSTANVFAGSAETWIDNIQALIVKTPVGKPDPRGVTECDMLAGDPYDTTLKVQGVDFETAAEDYDFERAVEACIVAVEYDTDATRQVYQLARVLDFLGDTDGASHYTDIAVARKYAPGLHLKAFSILTNRDDDDAFFDAIDLFKAASAMGFAPSKAELAELVPPGTEIWREIPPPSDTAILDTVGRKKCAGVSLMSACSIRTGVHKKNCMQTSATKFSCEIILRQRCQVNSSMGNDPVMGLFKGMMQNACPRTTDPMYLQFTKRGNGWAYRKEF